MPQWRKLHVKTIDSLDVNAMPDDFTRLMWLLLPLGLDSAGRGIDDSAWIKSKLFPLRRDVTLEQVDAAMCWYGERGMVLRYEIDARQYFCATKFAEYQGNTEREADSKIPAPVLYKTKKGLDKVKSNSRPTQDKGPNWSVTDVDVDTDAEVEGADAQPPKVKKANPTQPVAVTAYQQAAGRLPAKALWDDMQTAIGSVPGDLDFWGSVVRAWIAKGYNPANISGMFDYFKRRELPTSNGNGKQVGPATTGYKDYHA